MSEIIRQYEPWIGYFFYSAIFLAFCVTMYMYWRDRIRFEITKQAFHDSHTVLSFTATNMGNHRNSLDKKVVLKWLAIPLTPMFPWGKKHKHILTLNSEDSSLDSHETKKFKATIRGDMPHFFSNFRHYRFTPNRGLYTHLYFIGVANKNVSFLEFYFKRFLYRFFKVGLIYKPT